MMTKVTKNERISNTPQRTRSNSVIQFCWPLLINVGCHGNRKISSSYKRIVIKRPHVGKILVATL